MTIPPPLPRSTHVGTSKPRSLVAEKEKPSCKVGKIFEIEDFIFSKLFLVTYFYDGGQINCEGKIAGAGRVLRREETSQRGGRKKPPGGGGEEK